ncbi:MAG TPA: primary-amine oxidase, partial [Blastocatellia bacterium]
MKQNLSSLFSNAIILILLFSLRAFAQIDAHPLDPLTKDEIAAASETLRAAGKVTAEMRFQTIVLREPSKQEVLNYRAGQPFRREAFAVVYERAANKTYEAVVDVKNRAVISWKEIRGVQPSMMIDDVLLTNSIVRSNSEWQAAIRKRGITDFNEVQIEPWSAGDFGFAGEEGKRVVRAISFLRGKSRNAHARPIEGVIAYVDLSAKKVIKLVDASVVPVPKATADLDMASIGKMRDAVRGLQIVQSQPSFEVRGNEIRWQNWRFRYALHPREGLVLYTVSYNDDGRERSVLYRASLSEMVVPYGDPSAGWFFRNAFDAGEFGIGSLVASLEPGVDYPENALLFNATFANAGGGASEVPRAVALYERDGVVLWKHVDYMTGHNESRRARQFVLSFYANVGNYEYGFNWVFHQDGTIEMEAMLTGIMAVKGVDMAKAHDHSHGHLVADGIEAVHHQHIFNFRLDLDVDGMENSLVEMNNEALPPGPRNPYNNAFTVRETILKRELEAQRQLNLASGRRWKVINPTVKNSLGQSVGYLLFPGENALPYAGLSSQVRKRAAFMNAHLWATEYAPDEMNAAGYYINQSKG